MTVVTEPAVRPRISRPPRVVVTRRLPAAVEARMRELFDATLNPDDVPMDRAALVAAMREADVLVPTVTDRIDAGMIAEALDGAGDSDTRLCLIASFGAGFEHVDIAAARAHRVLVTNTPGVFTDDTADLAMALVIIVPRRIGEGARQLLAGGWPGWSPTGLLGTGLGGKRLGIVGMGRIGQAVAHRARAFGLEIVYHNRHRLPAAVENMLSARYEPDLDAMVAACDVVSLHCPATPETHHLIDAARLARFRPGAALVNTARGELVDEEALIAALESGHLGGAGLDVFAHEPELDPRFRALPNVVVLPHLASATTDGREAAGHKVIANIRFWADGHTPPDRILPGVS